MSDALTWAVFAQGEDTPVGWIYTDDDGKTLWTKFMDEPWGEDPEAGEIIFGFTLPEIGADRAPLPEGLTPPGEG